MDYVSPAEARDLPGVRLALTVGVPHPWAQVAKHALEWHGIPYVPVAQQPTLANEELMEWTGVRNAPVAVYESERPLTSCLDILLLAERLGEGRSLLPSRSDLRVACIGICHELCARDGLGWSGRVLNINLIARRMADAGAGSPPAYLFDHYGVHPAAIEKALPRMLDILSMLDARLEKQQAEGSPYLVGEDFSAADLYWADFCGMFAPPPDAICPMAPEVREMFSHPPEEVRAALTPRLLDLRDRVYSDHLVPSAQA